LRAAGVAGMGFAAAWLAACGGGDSKEGSNAGTAASGGQAAATAGSGGAPAAARRRGGTLRIGYHEDPGYLSPRASRSGFDPNWLMVNGDSYIYVKPDGTIDPANSLFQKYEFTDPTTLVFSVRQGVKFHDGTALTAEAVKAHLSYLMDKTKAKDFGYASILQPVASIETPDPSTVKFTLKEPSPGLLPGLGVQPGTPFSVALVEKQGDDERLKPALTGPYRVDAYTSGGGWSYVKNADFWGPKEGTPYLDKIEFRVLTEVAARGAALEAGDVDIAWFGDSDDTTLGLSKNRKFKQAKMFAGPTLLALNANKPPLDNLMVRQAVASAIDKAKVLDVINKGQGAVAKGGLLPPGTYGAIDHNPYPFDLNKAKQYLQQSGVSGPVKLKLTYGGTGSSTPSATTAQLYQSTLQAAGFQVELENTPGNSQFDVMFDQGNSHLLVFSTGVRPDPDAQFALYATSFAYYNAGRTSKDPSQAKLDELVSKGRVELDTKKREQIYHEITKVMLDNVLVAIPIIDRVRWVFAQQKVAGIDDPGFLNTPAGASMRARLLSMEA
jgi:peptide/nickel transport system substrate-binding protein